LDEFARVRCFHFIVVVKARVQRWARVARRVNVAEGVAAVDCYTHAGALCRDKLRDLVDCEDRVTRRRAGHVLIVERGVVVGRDDLLGLGASPIDGVHVLGRINGAATATEERAGRVAGIASVQAQCGPEVATLTGRGPAVCAVAIVPPARRAANIVVVARVAVVDASIVLANLDVAHVLGRATGGAAG